MFKQTLLGAGLLCVLLLCGPAGADVLMLRDGTSVEGSVIKFGQEYRVKLKDGTTRTIPQSLVASIEHGPADPSRAAFSAAKSRAETVDEPVRAVNIWERFIDDFPDSSQISAARGELEKWKNLQADQAERINGRWVGGDERRRILAEVNKLCTEARSQLDNQMLQAIDKYDRALKLYPNCYEANFALGYCYLQKGTAVINGAGNPADLDKAIKSLEAAVRLRPNSASALSNLAVGYSIRNVHDKAVQYAYQAVRIVDNKQTVENLVNILVHAPDALKQNNLAVRKVMPEAVLLAGKYNIPAGGTNRFNYVPPERGIDDPASGFAASPGIVGNGSGFLVSPDGYLITNRHVVEEKNRVFRVRLDDGTERPAEVVAIDASYDIALLKIKSDKPLPYLRLAEAPLPNAGARCMVLGFPIATKLDFQMQVVSGEVSSARQGEEYQVTLVASATHGNSGGPVVDRDGNVIGILSAGMAAFNATYLRAVSSGQVREFLERVKDKHTLLIDWAKPANTPFDPEKLAAEARKATVMVLILRGDGKDAAD